MNRKELNKNLLTKDDIKGIKDIEILTNKTIEKEEEYNKEIKQKNSRI